MDETLSRCQFAQKLNFIGRGTLKPILHRHLPTLRSLLPCGSERAHMRERSALGVGVMAYLDTP